MGAVKDSRLYSIAYVRPRVDERCDSGSRCQLAGLAGPAERLLKKMHEQKGRITPFLPDLYSIVTRSKLVRLSQAEAVPKAEGQQSAGALRSDQAWAQVGGKHAKASEPELDQPD